jgi:hypothetical protein
MNIHFNITEKEFPILFKFKKKEIDLIVKDIFKIGYESYFPEKNMEGIVENNKLVNKLDTLETVLEKLIGISSSSMRKGEIAENILENLITKKYGDIKYIPMAQVNHSGDAWLNFDSFEETVMLESKNYTVKVNKDEIIKMKNDMVTNNIQWGILVSFNSQIQGYREFDIDTFNHEGKVYTIVFLSELSKDIDRIDMGIQVIRKLVCNYSKLNNFPWITTKIKSDLEKLNEIINLNYQLRNWFTDMENNIKSSLNKYYTNMRDYQHKIDISINDIIKNIEGTMEDSLNKTDFNYSNYINEYKDNKKLFMILTKIVDKFKEKNIIVEDDNLIINNEIIGNIKIQKKKIYLYSKKINATSEFGIEEKDNVYCFIDLLI